MDDTVHPIPDEQPLTAEEHRIARWNLEHGGRLAGLDVYGLAGEDPPRTLPRPEALRPFEGSDSCSPQSDSTLEGVR